MHLTNYSVNKKSEQFVTNKDADKDDEGSKWSLTALYRYLDQQVHMRPSHMHTPVPRPAGAHAPITHAHPGT